MVFLIASLSCLTAAPLEKEPALNPDIGKYVEARIAEFERIPDDRKRDLKLIAQYVSSSINDKQPARLVFICTHNSRRSQWAQVWASTAAAHYGVSGVETFSGGTEATAFNVWAVDALRRAGFQISRQLSPENPHYSVRYRNNGPVLDCFSKIYNHAANPTAEFCAVLTCSQADKACPLVKGAAVRIALPFEDPKTYDDTPEETARYDERCRQIAREMLFVFSNVNK